MSETNLVIGIYYHPEAYPPTLNAVNELSGSFKHIVIIHRPHLKGTWKYPSNVTAIASGKPVTSSGQQMAATWRKVVFFLEFTWLLFKKCRSEKPRMVLLYDTHALLAYFLIRPFLWFDHLLWYHNHDITEISRERKFSVGWFACKAENRFFGKIDLFTLPSSERLKHFPLSRLKGSYFVIPNYPSLEFYRPFYNADRAVNELRLIFQGRIGDGHGLEEIISMLNHTIAGRRLSLVLKGHCHEEYKQKLLSLASFHKVEDKVVFIGFTPYEEVPRVASSCHVGIGIFSKKEVMHVSLGTASNKLYEYAAVGLPIIYLNNEHFSKYLEKYEWAFGTELDIASIEARLSEIAVKYRHYSAAAYRSFEEELNFEQHFRPVKDFVMSIV